MSERCGYVRTGRGYRIRFCTEGADDARRGMPLVLLCHGLGSQMRHPLIQYLQQHLRRRRYATLRFDFAGHGKSSGSVSDRTVRNFFLDLTDMVKWAAEHPVYHSVPLYVIGHSIGALAALMYAASPRQISSGVALVSCNADAGMKYRIMLRSGKTKRYRRYTRVGTSRVSRNFWSDRNRHEPRRYVARIRVPMLFLCGLLDVTNPPEETKKLYRLAHGSKEISLIPRADHHFRRSREQAAVFSILRQWLERA